MVAGSEDEVTRQLTRLEEAGATDFTAMPVGSREEQQRTLDFLRQLSVRVADGRRTPV
jgi:alkanesulfonate monooxygenase SsuD/methylene tetrahydromethanopterin reductase-like flavin-dependent oxidoreductase (luciferase family)